MDGKRLLDFGERYAASMVQPGRWARCRILFTDGSLRINDGVPAIGRDAIGGIVQGFMKAFPNLLLTMDDVRFEGDGAVYYWTFAGTNTRPRRHRKTGIV